MHYKAAIDGSSIIHLIFELSIAVLPKNRKDLQKTPVEAVLEALVGEYNRFSPLSWLAEGRKSTHLWPDLDSS